MPLSTEWYTFYHEGRTVKHPLAPLICFLSHHFAVANKRRQSAPRFTCQFVDTMKTMFIITGRQSFCNVCYLLLLFCATTASAQWAIPGQRVSVSANAIFLYCCQWFKQNKLIVLFYQFNNLASRPAHFANTTWSNHVLQTPSPIQSFSLEGTSLFDEVLTLRSLGHFNRERIPERVVHAKGSTFHGTFHATNPEIARYTKASVFGQLGKRTRVAARFSTSLGERGSADTPFGEFAKYCVYYQ